MKGKIAKYVTVGTNDLNRAKEFYDALFSDLEVTSFGPNERSFFWTIPGDDTNFAVFVPYDGEEATVGNGSMVGITLETTDDVDALYGEIVIYLGKLSKTNLSDEHAEELLFLFQTVDRLENIGDIMEKNMVRAHIPMPINQ